MQKLQVIGNLGADAELREKNGKKFVTFRIADTQKWTDDAGNVTESTTWISCIMQGDGGGVLQFLKQGVKVFVDGRPSYRVYSSPKLREMVAGVDLSVLSIELCGGSSDDVPRRLVDPASGALVETKKLYWVPQPAEKKNHFTQLIAEKGGKAFAVDNQGFITPIVEETK